MLSPSLARGEPKAGGEIAAPPLLHRCTSQFSKTPAPLAREGGAEGGGRTSKENAPGNEAGPFQQPARLSRVAQLIPLRCDVHFVSWHSEQAGVP